MGQKVTFDAATKIINVTLAPDGNDEVYLDAKVDLYSDGKEDWQTDATLNKLRFPLSAVGGNPLPGSKELGSTFFLASDWKIKPYESSHRLIVNGNLYSQDGSSPFVTTDGAFNIFLEQQVSSLVDSSVAQLSEIEHATYTGSAGPGVWVDVTSDSTGTEYPSGNSEHPVNNIPAAVSIAADRGLACIYVKGNLALGAGDNVSGMLMVGQNAARTVITINDAAQTFGCEIREALVTGNLDGGTILRACVIESLNYINGFVFECMLNPGTISLGGSETAHFLNCYSGVPGLSTPIIDCDGVSGGSTPLALRGYNGGIELRNKTNAASCSIDLASGQVKIHDSCINGLVVIRGDGKVISSPAGTHMMTGTHNGNLIINNECNFGGHLHDLWEMSMRRRKWDKPAGTVTIYGDDGVTPKWIFDTNSDMSELTPQ